MRFIGNKKNLLPYLEKYMSSDNMDKKVFCDLFSGTANVGIHFKKLGYQIISSDLLYFSYVLQKTYIEQNKYPKFETLLKYLGLKTFNSSLFNSEDLASHEVINYLNKLEGEERFIFKNYCPDGTKDSEIERKYFSTQNAKKIDAIRNSIEKWWSNKVINEDEYYFLICSLVEAVPFVSNISGTYGSFLKTWDNRAFKTLHLETPIIIKSNRKHFVYNMNGLEVLKNHNKIDILYLDPPYNERQYAPNYHILETIAMGDQPKLSGKTGLRDYQDKKSEFCNAKTGIEALEKIIQSNSFKKLYLSYNNEGIIKNDDIISLFNNYGKTNVEDFEYQRFKSNSNGKQKSKVIEKLYSLKKVHRLNKLNDLSGGEWNYFLNSVMVTHYSTGGADGFPHKIRKQHPSPKPPQLMAKFINFFTKENQCVLDPFMGVGGTLIGCSLTNRKGIGIDLSEKYIDLYNQVCNELNLDIQKTFVGDSNLIDSFLSDDTIVDFILTDPPYGDMLSKKRTGQLKPNKGDSTPFTDNENDLGNMGRDSFFESLKIIIEKSIKFLKPKGYVAIFVKDLQPKGKIHNMLHVHVAEKILEIEDLSYRGYKIWYDATQKLYPFGYPHAFVSNQFHQFILFFRKEK